MNCKQIIVKRPSPAFSEGLTTVDLGRPVFKNALVQHEAYIQAMKKAGAAVKELKPDDHYPDSTFVEDPAVVTKDFAVITRPGTASRQGETADIHHALTTFYDAFYTIEAPGTIEGGDVLQIEDHFYVGSSDRTNEAGIQQFKTIVEGKGYTVTAVEVNEVLHLKTGISYLGEGHVIVAGEFIDHPAFTQYEQIVLPPEEAYAANCIRVNDAVIIPEGFPVAKKKIEAAGYAPLEVGVSEFRKQDGGLSCLSLRF